MSNPSQVTSPDTTAMASSQTGLLGDTVQITVDYPTESTVQASTGNFIVNGTTQYIFGVGFQVTNDQLIINAGPNGSHITAGYAYNGFDLTIINGAPVTAATLDPSSNLSPSLNQNDISVVNGTNVLVNLASLGGTTIAPNAQMVIDLATGVGAILVNNTVPSQSVTDAATVSPFSHVFITDPNIGADTLTVTLSNPAAGTLSNLGGGSYDSALGVYTVSGTASAVSSALDGLVFQPARDQAPAGQTVTTNFTIKVTDTAGASATDSTTSVITTETSATYGAVQSGYQAILRTTPDAATVSQPASQIDSGSLTLPQYETSLINSEQALYTSLPALVTIDAMYGATPSSATLTTAATATSGVSYYTAAGLHNLGYSDPNVWTIMGSEWSADPNSSFYTTYGSYGSDYSSFISAVYQQEFGYAPSSQNLQNLLSDVPGVQALLAGGGHPASPIQVVGGIYGYLLYVGQTYGIGQYASSAKAFLQAAANGTVTYGPELTKEFPPTTTQTTTSSGTSSSTVMANAQNADPSIITVTGSDQLIDPGSGGYTIQFMAGASADTLVLHAGGVDQVSGFNPNSDFLDFGSLLGGANIDLKGNLALLANYVGITDQGSDALVSFAPNGQGSGSTVAVLHGLGSTVTSLNSLITAGAVKIA